MAVEERTMMMTAAMLDDNMNSRPIIKQQQSCSNISSQPPLSSCPKSSTSLSSSSAFVGTTTSTSAALVARTVLLDAPLLCILVLYASVVWIHHVHDAYLEPQLHAMRWTPERKEHEMTYYARSCAEHDISTSDASDFILSSPNATALDTLNSVLQHGFAMFPKVLSPDTSSALRQYIVDRNKNLTNDSDAIWNLHQIQHRYSFSMNAQASIVQQALMQVANHAQLSAAVQQVLGDDPALIEVSAITSEYGSDNQDYHPDVLSDASATRYARSYAPTFSLFIQLQDTTKEMGATSACPGTHVCTNGDNMEDLCEEHGIQVVNKDGIWPQGDALLMYSNTHHRGSAHVDPDALDRVMWVLIFTTRPHSVAESRQVSSGISNRWDMWGFTWNDMRHANVNMVPTSLRAVWKSLGLFKPSSSSWGIDYITISCNRLVQKDWIFGDERLEMLFDNYGGLPQLASWGLSFLQGDVNWDDDYPWHGFLLSTLVKIQAFIKTLVVACLIGYTLLAITSQSYTFFLQSTRRLLALCGMVYLAFFMARRHVDSTLWAKDIRANRRYSSAMDNEHLFVQQQQQQLAGAAATTFPNRHDVLIEQRYSSSHRLALQSNYIDGAHYGNVGFYKLVRALDPTFAAYPEMFRWASARYIVDAVALDHGRFLTQGIGGNWHHVAKNNNSSDDEWTMDFTIKELAKHASPHLGSLMQGIQQGIGAYRFGMYRNSALASKHMVPYLRSLESKLLQESRLVTQMPPMPRIRRQAVVIVRTLSTNTPSKTIFQRAPSAFVALPKALDTKANIRSPSFAMTPTEPTPGAWLESDDLVEGKVNGDWYVGRLLAVTARGFYFVNFPNGDDGVFEHDDDEIRHFEPYEIGESVELLVDEDGYQDDDEAYVWCEIVSRTDDDRYTVKMKEDDTIVEDMTAHFLRRVD